MFAGKLVLVLGLFLIVSVVLSLVGLGGGVFYVPLLLVMGYPFPLAASTSLFLITVTGFSAFSRFRLAKLVDWQLAVVMDTFTDLGAFVGGYTAVHFSESLSKSVLAVLLMIAAVFTYRGQVRGSAPVKLKRGFGYWERHFAGYAYSLFLPVVIPITFVIGFLSGALGIAGGIFKVPIMILWFGVPAKIAVATSSLMVGLTGLMGFGGHLFTGQIDWALCFGLGIVVLIGGQIGSRVSIRLPERKLKQVLAAVLMFIALWMLWRQFG